MKKIIPGDKINYGKDGHIPVSLLFIIGGIIIIGLITSIFRAFLEGEGLGFGDVLGSLIYVSVAFIPLSLGVKIVLSKKRLRKKFRYIKENGLKADGKIKKGYTFFSRLRFEGDASYTRYHYYILKISYFNKETNKIETFMTPIINGSIESICDDSIDVYYYKGEAVIDNLRKGDETINFEEGIIEGFPENVPFE